MNNPWLPLILIATTVAVGLALAAVLVWSYFQQRTIKRARLDDPNEVRPSDMAQTIRTIARLQRAQDANTASVGVIEARSDDLRRTLVQVLDELAIRPAPDPIVRLLFEEGDLSLDQLVFRLGKDVPNRIQDLIETYQITRLEAEEGTGIRYRFVPHAVRPDDAGYAGRRNFWSLSRLIAMSTEIRSASAGLQQQTVPMLPEPEDAESTSFQRALREQQRQTKRTRAALPKGA